MKRLFTFSNWPIGRLLTIGLTAWLTACEKPSMETPVPAAESSVQARITAPDCTGILDDFFTQSGGATTVNSTSADALNHPAPNLSGANLALHAKGRTGFEHVFALGQMAPLWNHEHCQGCHVNGGRAAAPIAGSVPQLLFRVSVNGKAPDGGPKFVPGYGDQIQPFAVVDGKRGQSIEGQVSTAYVEQVRRFVDGITYRLRQPTYTFSQRMPAGVMLSPRTAPQIAGVGLLEAIPESAILALADPQDQNHDGISGRPNYVWDVAARTNRLGRFGWKANQPSLLQQNAAAYNGDLGITSPYFAKESNVPGGGRNRERSPRNSIATNISTEELKAVTFYTQTLGVPALRNPADPIVKRGRAIFLAANCGTCHVPIMRTGTTAPNKSNYDPEFLTPPVMEVANQVIAPFTDLLLHDMGPGLADNRPDFLASGQEWRTPPLWGIGLTETVNGHSYFLHDGRARSLLEAIMWHGGEAAPSASYVNGLSNADRQALITFLNSL